MTVGKGRRWGWIVLGVLALIAAGGIVGFRVAVEALKDRVIDTLGPESEIAELRVGWSSLDVEGLRIAGPKGWPTSDALRAERVSIVPSLRGVLSGQPRVQSITAIRPYLSALRTRDGQLQVLPTLLAGPHDDAATARKVTIDRITLQGGVLDLFDASVAQPPLEIHLDYLDYRNERGRYVEAFLEHLIDWDFVAANLEAEPPRAIPLTQHASEMQGI